MRDGHPNACYVHLICLILRYFGWFTLESEIYKVSGCRKELELEIWQYLTTSLLCFSCLPFLYFLGQRLSMKGPQIGDLAIPDRHLLAAAGDKRYTDCAGPYLLCRKQRLQMQMEPWREPSEGSGV